MDEVKCFPRQIANAWKKKPFGSIFCFHIFEEEVRKVSTKVFQEVRVIEYFVKDEGDWVLVDEMVHLHSIISILNAN